MSDELMLACAFFGMAGGLYAAFAGGRRRKDDDEDEPVRLVNGAWYPKSKRPAPPPPPAPPPAPCSRATETRRTLRGGK
jgi:hypothetical protein